MSKFVYTVPALEAETSCGEFASGASRSYIEDTGDADI